MRSLTQKGISLLLGGVPGWKFLQIAPYPTHLGTPATRNTIHLATLYCSAKLLML